MSATRYVVDHVYGVAVELLPGQMWEREAFALLTAIGLQESRFVARRQFGNGPARGFWQFELGGVEGVLEHRATRAHALAVLSALGYSDDARAAHLAVEHNDVLACCFARLLLWTDPRPLASVGEASAAWLQYLSTWRPGKPYPQTWGGFYARAWSDAPWREVVA